MIDPPYDIPWSPPGLAELQCLRLEWRFYDEL